jgi:hypothetical protein
VKKPASVPERNVELLQATMNFIEKHPEKHEQSHWVTECGTAFCYAGHASLLAGATPPSANVLEYNFFWTINPETFQSQRESTMQQLESGNLAVDEFAARQLGITMAESEVMFSGDRTREELRMLVDALCDGAWIDEDEEIWLADGRHGYVDYWLERDMDDD